MAGGCEGEALTTIAAAIVDRRVAIGSDSLLCIGDSATSGVGKVLIRDGWGVAWCGSSLLARAIAEIGSEHFTSASGIGDAVHAWMRARDQVRDGDMGGCLIVARAATLVPKRPAEVWLVGGDGSTSKHDAIAAGSGRPEALGALYACRAKGVGAEESVRLAIQAGITHDAHSGGEPCVLRVTP